MGHHGGDWLWLNMLNCLLLMRLLLLLSLQPSSLRPRALAQRAKTPDKTINRWLVIPSLWLSLLLTLHPSSNFSPSLMPYIRRFSCHTQPPPLALPMQITVDVGV